MIRKVILVVLTLFAIGAFGLNLVGCPEKVCYHRGENGCVTDATSVSCDRGALIVVLQRAYDHQNPTWVGDINIWPLYTRYSYFDHRRQLLHPERDPMFIMMIVNQLELWVLVVLFGGYPALTFVHGPLRRYRRRRMGRCQNCGYDLTGNVSGRCPECGEEIRSRWA